MTQTTLSGKTLIEISIERIRKGFMYAAIGGRINDRV